MKSPLGGVVMATTAVVAIAFTATPVNASPLATTVSAAEDGGPVAPSLLDETRNGATVRVNVVTAQRTDLASVADAGQTLVSYSTLPMTTLRVDRAGLEKLNAQPGVVSVTEDVPVKPTLDESTVKIGGDKTFAAGKTGAGTTVAVLDTGVAVNHPFLSGRVKAEACFSDNDPVAGSTSLCPDGSAAQEGPGSADTDTGPCAVPNLDCSHGTHVAGIAAGNGAGLSGAPRRGVAPGASVIAIQVFSKFDSEDLCGAGLSPCVASFTSSQVKGLEKVLALKKAGTDIVAANMSLGGGRWTTACDQDLRKPVVDALRAAGVATVVAAGNNGHTDAVNAPGCIPSAITVGSTTDDDQLSSFTNRGPLLDLLAPGTGIVSSIPGGGYGTKNGTSMAAPHVTGALAVLRQTYPNLGVDQLEALLKSNGRAITYTGATTPRIQLDRSALPAVPGDMTGDGKPDLVAIDDAGKLWLYPGTGTGGLGTRIQIGTGGWGGASMAHRGDWTGDLKEDIVAVVAGDLWVYPNRGDGTLGARIKLATLSAGTRILAPGDVNRDGHPDLLANTHEGLSFYTGTSAAKPAVSSAVSLGYGWPLDGTLAAPGDVNNDGVPDLLYRGAETGALTLHYGRSAEQYFFHRGDEYGRGYTLSHRPLIAGAADADLNGVADMWATAGDGTLKFYQGGLEPDDPPFARPRPIDGPSIQVGSGGWHTIRSIS
ncbi:S8 family serine peptidase [Streptomyces sp. NPDC059247]|uniref:S8 family serine peptidase n=1 Tax=Streptomyces sp. NPDC059247 TaxID=3346790 RepID=UPI0036A46E7A